MAIPTRPLYLALALAAAGCTSSADGPTDASPPTDGGADASATEAGDGAVLPPPFTYEITIDDPKGTMTASHAALTTCVATGLDLWGQYLTGTGKLKVQIAVTTTTTGRFAGASATSNAVGKCKNTPQPCTLGEDQAIHRLRTGQDNPSSPNEPDVRISVTPDYWANILWMDPEPKSRTATVPGDRDDAISVCTHELGHAFGMAGYRDLATFAPTPQPNFGSYLSLYDDLVKVGSGGTTLTFEGPKTVAELGPIPLTREHTTQNVYHYGNKSTATAYDDKLMNGIVYEFGTRYLISRVDVLILSDLGVPIRALPPK